MQAIFRGAYWLRFWGQQQHKDSTKEIFKLISSKLEVIALEIANFEWKHHLRVG